MLVYQQYIYQTMPELMRACNDEALQYYAQFKQEMTSRSQVRGFRVVDFGRIVREFQASSGSPYAGFALYVDHCHLSALPTRLVAERLPAP